jgi:hypothetical protein
MPTQDERLREIAKGSADRAAKLKVELEEQKQRRRADIRRAMAENPNCTALIASRVGKG